MESTCATGTMGPAGTVRAALQEGHWICLPLLLPSQEMCCPQPGQGKVKSDI
jgi:hypothetical protein